MNHGNALRPAVARRETGARGPQQWLWPGRHWQPLGDEDAGGDGVCLMRHNPVAQSRQALNPRLCRFPVYTAGESPSGIVHSRGTPIIHSIKDGLTECLNGGRFARPVNPYAAPIKKAVKLLVVSQDSLQRR
jgi:hypothetical protein